MKYRFIILSLLFISFTSFSQPLSNGMAVITMLGAVEVVEMRVIQTIHTIHFQFLKHQIIKTRLVVKIGLLIFIFRQM